MSQLAALLPALRGGFGDFTLSGPRARHGVMASLAVGAAIVLALALHVQDPWWAGISAFICTQATQPQLLQKAALRIAGTVGGAAFSYALAPWAMQDQAALLLLLFVAGMVGTLGALVSRFGYAWQLSGMTIFLVTLGALDEPSQFFSLAVYRTADIVLGVATSIAVGWLMASDDAAVVSAAPGWRSVLGENWHAVLHAARAGLAVASVPLVWRYLELPNLNQMAVSIASVMAVPALRGVPALDQAAIAKREWQRVAGCLLGGGAALLLVGSPAAQSFLPWLLAIMVGVFLAIQLQTCRFDINVVGMQAGIALLLTAMQGWGPPASLAPAILRIAGMLGA
ncbi:MAG TPA: FUSC family protein, partial [Acetobacteraceae bacterium]|nr:FUSC family protein [Acetobacteraceae bacterium]